MDNTFPPHLPLLNSTERGQLRKSGHHTIMLLHYYATLQQHRNTAATTIPNMAPMARALTLPNLERLLLFLQYTGKSYSSLQPVQSNLDDPS